MSKEITGPLKVQPIREGRFELRDTEGMTVGTFQHEEHAEALARGYNDSLIFNAMPPVNYPRPPQISWDEHGF